MLDSPDLQPIFHLRSFDWYRTCLSTPQDFASRCRTLISINASAADLYTYINSNWPLLYNASYTLPPVLPAAYSELVPTDYGICADAAPFPPRRYLPNSTVCPTAPSSHVRCFRTQQRYTDPVSSALERGVVTVLSAAGRVFVGFLRVVLSQLLRLLALALTVIRAQLGNTSNFALALLIFLFVSLYFHNYLICFIPYLLTLLYTQSPTFSVFYYNLFSILILLIFPPKPLRSFYHRFLYFYNTHLTFHTRHASRKSR